MAIYSGFSHWKWWFSIVMLVYQRVNPLEAIGFPLLPVSMYWSNERGSLKVTPTSHWDSVIHIHHDPWEGFRDDAWLYYASLAIRYKEISSNWMKFPSHHGFQYSNCQTSGWFWVPSGELTSCNGKIHHFSWENPLFLWPFSIAFCLFTRGYHYFRTPLYMMISECSPNWSESAVFQRRAPRPALVGSVLVIVAPTLRPGTELDKPRTKWRVSWENHLSMVIVVGLSFCEFSWFNPLSEGNSQMDSLLARWVCV